MKIMNLGLALLAISISCAGPLQAAPPSGHDALAQTSELNMLQVLDRKMLDARGTPEFQPTHDAFGAAMLKLCKGPDVTVLNESDDSAILARLQSLGRQLGANPRDSDAYKKVHEEFEILIKALGRRGTDDRSRAAAP